MNGENMFAEIFELLMMCLVFIGVLWLTYFITRKIATMNKKMGSHKNMEVKEVLPLLQGQYLYIVKVGNEFCLIGCAQKGKITYLKTLEANQLKFEEGVSMSFQQQLIQYMKGKQVSKDEEKK